MTSLSRELATKRPAEITAAGPLVIDGEARRTRPMVPASHLGAWLLFLTALLFAGFMLSLWQQAS
jgi:hypothetical protein